jgi:uncharacterized protein YacL
MFNLCAPALIYIAFSLTQVIIDTFKGLYNTAFFKFIVMIIVTLLLNALCQSGMSIISWIIVFIPFIFMSVIVTILLYIFGLDAATGKLNFKCKEFDNKKEDKKIKSGNLIYSINNIRSNDIKVTPTYIDTSYSDYIETMDDYVPTNLQYES